LPVPHKPQELGVPLQEASPDDAPPVLEAKRESFFFNFLEPHAGQAAPFARLDRTRISLSFPHS
jgi:hypothetical protein